MCLIHMILFILLVLPDQKRLNEIFKSFEDVTFNNLQANIF